MSIELAIAGATRALERGDRAAALDELLVAWRIARHPALADAIDELVAPFDEVLRTRARTQEEWLDDASPPRAAFLGVLLRGLAWLSFEAAEQRIDRLASWPDDPRLAAGLADFVVTVPFVTATTHKLWRRVFKLLARQRCPRAAARLAQRSRVEAGETFRTMRAEGIAQVLAQLTAPDELDAVTVAALVACRRAAEVAAVPSYGELVAHYATIAPRADATEAELLARIADDPDADEPRQVLADFYLERGDPRGEIMALQLASLQAPRLAKLVRAHRDLLLGTLEPLVDKDSARFERGCLVACETLLRTPAQRAAALGNPRWATVRELDTDDARLVADPMMRSLHVVRGLSIGALAELALGERELPIIELGIRVTGFDIGSDWERAAIAHGRALPHLRKLVVDLAADLPNAPLAAREIRWLVDALPQLGELAIPRARAFDVDSFAALLERRAPPFRLVLGELVLAA